MGAGYAMSEKQQEDKATYTITRQQYHRIARADILLRNLVRELGALFDDINNASGYGEIDHKNAGWILGELEAALRRVGPPWYVEETD
jgi:hypothetical protein